MRLLVAVCILLMSTPGVVVAAGPAVGSVELVERPQVWDGRTITFTGEAVRESMVRGDSAWIHLNDDAYATVAAGPRTTLAGYNSGLGVWTEAAAAEEVSVFGDYRHRGDLVRAEGVFNAACAQHGGDMDIHASRLEIVSQGGAIPYVVEGWKAPAALALALAAVLLSVAERRMIGRESRGARRVYRAAGR